MKNRKKTLNKKNFPEQNEIHNKPNQDDLKVIIPTFDVKTDLSIPKHGCSKISRKECFTERRRSRRLGNLPPLDIIVKTEDGEKIDLHYDSESLPVLNCNTKIKQEKIVNKQNCEVFDDIDSNSLGLDQTFRPLDNTLLDKSENQNFSFDQSIPVDKINVKIEPIDNSSLLNGDCEENIKHLDTDESKNKTVIPVINEFYADQNINNMPLELNQYKSLSESHLIITTEVEKSVSLNNETQQNVKPIDNVLVHENQYLNSSSNNICIFDDIDLNNQIIKKIIQKSKLLKDTFLDKSENQFANSSSNNICIFDDIDSNDQENIVKTSKLLDYRLLDKNENENLSFDQCRPIDKINLKIEPLDNLSSLSEGRDKNIKSLNSDECQNETVVPVNNEIYANKNKNIMLLDQDKLLSGEALLKVTPEVEKSVSLNNKTQQNVKPVDNVLLNNKQDTYGSSNDVCDTQGKLLSNTSLKVDYIDLTTNEDDKINQKKIIEKLVPKLRCVPSELLYKSPTFARNIENKLTSMTDDCITKTPSIFECTSNPKQTNSENVNASNYTGLYNSFNNINDDKSGNLTSSNLKILESWSYSPSDWQVYSEETNKTNYTHEVNSKITQKAETQSKYNFEATNKLSQIKDTFNTQEVNLQDVNFDMAEINYKETNFNITQIESTVPKKSLSKITETKNTILTQDETYSKTTSITKTPNLPKPYSEMTIIEKKLYREKLSYMSSLGLVPVDEIKNTIKEKKMDSKCSIPKKGSFLSKPELHTTTERAYYRTSSEKLKRSYLLEYSDESQKHKAVPVLVPEKTSGLSFHEGRTCKDKCSSCHGKFGLLDTPCHIAQIKNHAKQKACLENATHLIGPNSCLCTACFRSIEKRSCGNYLPKDGCIVMPCKRTANRVFNSPWLTKVKELLPDRGMILRSSHNTKENMLFCHIHYNKVENIIKCQLCGCRSTPKYQLSCEEALLFQKVLFKDEVYLTLDYDLFICKQCKIYFLWQTKEKMNHSEYSADFEKHRITMLQRICIHRKINLPPFLNIKKVIQQSHDQQQHMQALSLPLVHTQPNKQTESSLNLKIPMSTITNAQPLKPNDKQSNQLSQTVVYKKTEKPTYKETMFVPVLKPVDNLHVLSGCPRVLPKLRKPIQLESFCQPSPLRYEKPILMVKKKKQLDKDILKITAHIERRPLKLFEKLQIPYSDPGELMNHLLLLEKFRRLGIIKLENDPNKNTNMNTTKLQSKVNSNLTNCTPALKHQLQFFNFNGPVQKKPRIENNCIAEARKNCTQQNTPQPFVSITKSPNYLKIPQTVHAERLVCNPTQSYSKTIDSNYKNQQVVLTKIPSTSNNAVKKSAIYNIMLTPPTTSIGTISKNSVTSTNSSVTATPIISLKTNCNIAPAKVTTHHKSITNLPNKVIFLKKLNHNETMMNLNSVNKETGTTNKTLRVISKVQSTGGPYGAPLWKMVSRNS